MNNAKSLSNETAAENLLQGNKLLEEGNIEQAIDFYRRALKENPSLSEAYSRLGEVLNLDEAIALYGEAVEHQPQNPEFHYLLGKCLRQQQQWIEAVSWLEKAIALKPDYWEAYHELGDSLLGRDDLESAVAAYGRCLELKPDFTWSHYNMGMALYKLGRWWSVLRCYERVSELEPEFWEVRSENFVIQNLLGDVLLKNERYSEAIAPYCRALAVKPDAFWSNHNLGLAYLNESRYSEAAESFERAIEIDSSVAQAHYNLGEVYSKLEQYSEAEEAYRRAKELQPSMSIIDQKLADVKRSQGSFSLQQEPLVLPQSSNPTVSIIIPVFNEIDYTIACLQAIAKNVSDSSAIEVIVVNDGSQDATEETLALVEGLKIVNNSENLGFLRSCNNGVAAAVGEYLYFLNNDTEIGPGCLESLLEVFAQDEEVGAVGSRLVHPDGVLQEAGAIIWSDGEAWNYGYGHNALDPRYNYLREVDYCSGASLLVKKEIFDELGGFGEDFAPAYYEDTDLCFAIRERLGKKVMYQPRSLLVHHQGISCGTSTSSGIKSYLPINREKFREKWQQVLETYPENKGADGIERASRRFQGERVVLVIDTGVDGEIDSFLVELKQLNYHVMLAPDDGGASDSEIALLQEKQIEVLYTCDGYDISIEEQIKERLPLCDFVCFTSSELKDKYKKLIQQQSSMVIIEDTESIEQLLGCASRSCPLALKLDYLDETSDATNAQNPEFHFQLGKAMVNMERWDEAIAQFRSATLLKPDYWEAYHELGDALLKPRRWEEAVVAYGKALELNPDSVWSYHNLGVALFQLKRWEEVFVCYDKIAEVEPKFWEVSQNDFVQYQLGEVRLKQERWDEAVEAYRRAIELNPENGLYYYKLGDAASGQGEWDEAVEAYGRAIELEKDFPEAQQKLNYALYGQSGFEAAKKSYLKTIEQEPKDPESYEGVLRQKVYKLIERSGLFDTQYYMANNPELAAADVDPLEHYIDIGATEGCNPNPLFHSSYYLEQNPNLAKLKLNPLAHYIAFGAAEGKNPNPLFDSSFYLEQNKDVSSSGMNPLAHYIAFGAAEGRVAWAANKAILEMRGGNLNPSNCEYLKCLRNNESTPVSYKRDSKIGIYCSSLGNYFMTEIADFMAAAFTHMGLIPIRLSEVDERPGNIDYDVIVAPHEFFYLGEGKSWVDRPWLSRAAMVNVEQPHTIWFAKSLHFLMQAPVVFDINLKSAAILETLGVPAYFLPLGYLSDYKPFSSCTNLPDSLALKSLGDRIRNHIPDPDAPLENRPIDLHFIGTLNERREQFFARNASWLSELKCFLHIPPIETPLLKGEDRTLDIQAAIGLSRLSKILLNIHREELPYFEWHRIVFHGLWQKTLVVTEPCHEVPGLIPQEHFIECELEDMAAKVDWLLHTEAGRAKAERVRQAGHEALKKELEFDKVMNKALGLLAIADSGLGGKVN